jgi:serine/threonine-protein kinase
MSGTSTDVIADATTLADFMLLSIVQGAVTLAVIEPGDRASTVTLEKQGIRVASFEVASEVATATCLRLAIAARLELAARAGTAEGDANVARVPVRCDPDVGEVLVSLVARGAGVEAEVRALTVNGKAPVVARSIALKRCRKCAAYQPAQASTCEGDGGALVEVEDRPEPGGTIGQYLVGARIGEGGDGVVFKGKHAVIGRPVAIKLLSRAYGEPDARRFFSEARATSKLRHPNVIEVTDFGLLSTGRPYIVMEELKGQSLYARLDAEPLPDPIFALRVAREIARGLAAAHEAGVVHNDLKPSNVMLLEGSTDEAPRVKVLDFGAASHVGRTQEGEGGMIFGTAQYMSPEHGSGLPTDPRSDLYALGVLLYEMLSGAVPFEGEPADVMRNHMFAAVPPVSRPGAAFPPAVTRTVARCLRKSAEERPQSANELGSDLTAAISALERPVWRRWLP